MEIQNFTFKGKKTGKHLLVFGAIHGNETCGTEAIHKIIKQLNQGDITLLLGKVTFVPICNIEAYKKKLRYIDEDLNRIITRHSNPVNNEQRVANALCPLIEECDTLLDLHSMRAKSNPCVFEEAASRENRAYIKALNIENIFIGWEKLYQGINKNYSTERYACEKNKEAVTVECGQHNDVQAPMVAYHTILNALAHLHITKSFKVQKTKQHRIRFTHVVYKPEKATFTKNWQHMDALKKGDIIGQTAHKQYRSPIDGYIIMPSTTAQTGSEWYYLGVSAS